MNPLISIITANYNKAPFVAQTIESVMAQTYSNWELIVVDDCSTDHSLDVIVPFLTTEKIRLYKNEKNRGGNFCRNQGLREAKGAYVLFLDADDLLAPDCLQGRAAAADKSPEKNLFIFTMGVFYTNPGDGKGLWLPKSRQPLKDFLQHTLPWSIMQPLWKTDFISRLGGFDVSFLRLQDVELNTRALLSQQVNYQLVGGVPDCYYRIDEGRKNYQLFAFLSRWVDSALHYCDKMKHLAPVPLRSYLLGTIYQTYFQLLYHFRLKQISPGEFEDLERKLLSYSQVGESGWAKKFLFSLSKIYNLHFFRIPGFNRFLKACIVS